MKRNEDENGAPVKTVSNTAFFAVKALRIGGLRTQLQVRATHLKKQGRPDADTEKLFELIRQAENFADDTLKNYIEKHPTARWWMRISGVNRESIGKLIGYIENFGRWYEVGDPMIPSYVKREPVVGKDGKQYIWVEGIERLATPSKLFTFACVAPGSKREEGKKSRGCDRLKTVLFQLMYFGFIMKKNRYYEKYNEYKAWKKAELEKARIKIMPTQKGRFCSECKEEKKVPTTTRFCPDCGAKLEKKEEPEGVKFEGHLDFMARRWAEKLFLTHTWTIWRKALGLPVRDPYPIEKMGHVTVIDPWEMCDLPEDALLESKSQKDDETRDDQPPADV